MQCTVIASYANSQTETQRPGEELCGLHDVELGALADVCHPKGASGQSTRAALCVLNFWNAFEKSTERFERDLCWLHEQDWSQGGGNLSTIGIECTKLDCMMNDMIRVGLGKSSLLEGSTLRILDLSHCMMAKICWILLALCRP